VLGCVLTWTAPAAAQTQPPTQPPSEAECRLQRERLTDHARASEAVRRAVAARAAAVPAPRAVAAAPTATPTATPRTQEAIRARLQEIATERQKLEEQRLGAMVRFDLSRASQIQGQISALDTERSKLEQDLASAPAVPPAPAPAAPPAPVETKPAAVTDADRIPCTEMPGLLDTAVKTRRKELGARETQVGAIPLVPLKGQSPERIARELAAQFAAWPQAASQVGLLDQSGDGRLDGVVDTPAKDLFRLYRQRADGTLGVETFALAGAGAGYGEMSRRLEEQALRQTNRRLEDVLAARAAGAVRSVGETAEFAKIAGQFLAGNFADAAAAGSVVARSVEFENVRGESVRLLEILAPITGGVEQRRLVVVAGPGGQEVWEETSTRIQSSSYWRTDVELRVARETRTAAGAVAGTRTTTGPITFSVER
jgi:hypothetical protein